MHVPLLSFEAGPQIWMAKKVVLVRDNKSNVLAKAQLPTECRHMPPLRVLNLDLQALVGMSQKHGNVGGASSGPGGVGEEHANDQDVDHESRSCRRLTPAS